MTPEEIVELDEAERDELCQQLAECRESEDLLIGIVNEYRREEQKKEARASFIAIFIAGLGTGFVCGWIVLLMLSH